MHAFDLANIANVYAQQSETQVALRDIPSKEAAHAYWLANRFRHEYWSGRLAAHREAIQRPGVSARNSHWLEILPVIQEVLLSEPLARCVAYHATVLEEEQICFDFAPLAQSALTAHVEARHRCLHLIVFGAGLSVELAVRLNRLRRLMETFSDQLIATMRPVNNLDMFSFDSPSTRTAQRQWHADSASSACCRVNASSLSSWLARVCSTDIDSRAASPRLNFRLSQVVLELLPSGSFDGFGVSRSQSAARLASDSLESNGNQMHPRRPLASPLDVLLTPKARRPMMAALHRRW